MSNALNKQNRRIALKDGAVVISYHLASIKRDKVVITHTGDGEIVSREVVSQREAAESIADLESTGYFARC